MKTRIAIYGFDRLGRSVCNVALKRHDLELVAVYAEMTPEKAVEALQSDPIYSVIEREVTAEKSAVIVDGTKIALVPRALGLSWQDYDVDVVIDCVSAAATNEQTAKHEKAGAKRVIFAAAGDETKTVILGVNEDDLSQAGTAISAGGAVAAAVSPVREILAGAIGVERSLVTTIDGAVGCAVATTCVCDEACNCADDCLCSKDGAALTIPAPTLVASVSELVFVAKRSVTVAAVNEALKKAAAEAYYQGIVTVSDEPIDSDSVIGESYSAVVDLGRTDVQDQRLVSVKVWYDREWAYANRLVELTADFGKTIKRT